ncbi:MAG: hypothetical protein JOY71_13945 [Acetobacteraceae bacterium]|nr:hypothetical protein [Acetobacteraceae bacterium]MBV8523202.1 hypothetical protein [Acetobacteraceae bacterium]
MLDDAVARAERHVWQAEAHFAHLARIIEEWDKMPEHGPTVAILRKVLPTLQQSLELAREHLSRERQKRGLEP